MTSAYQQQLKTQLTAAEDELGKLRRERAALIKRTQLAEAGARERAAFLEHARDLPRQPVGRLGGRGPVRPRPRRLGAPPAAPPHPRRDPRPRRLPHRQLNQRQETRHARLPRR